MATLLQNIVRYSTRSHSGGLLNSLAELERVYRRRLNRLAPRRLLATLGEEAISDIHLLFAQNNQPSPMDDLCKPCDFSNIIGYPHDVPDKAIEKLRVITPLVPSLTSPSSTSSLPSGVMLVNMRMSR